MKNKLSKKQAQEKIQEFFKVMKNKTPKEIKKIKRIAMKHKIPLKEKRKLFCNKCLNAYSGKEKIRIKDKIKSITCENCKKISRWKVKN
jgi:RNase P subunit RPR2